ncbi:glutamate 5-kinase [Pelagicoccus albus]|uniref:Glutamate 5-kinase n=1 Tax=Pelagicoccus albus TaxID=415222 RepID=A0A7X1E8K0_9BACT|nr:glutamate 5-kinase [Pelagicoccus albus]MBC2604867.1 glutamate 5-kinase [Pelagicoccus albus]
MRRVVIKLGTGILTHGIGQVDTDRINKICSQVAELRKRGIETLIVSSGAVGMGMGVLNLQARPKTMAKQQACAAIGQSRLIQCWQDGLSPHGLIGGQVLLTHDDLRIRNRYVNAKATIDQLLAFGVVPIINENDTVSSYEIRFGNNDILGAMVASLCDADQYQILSTAPGLIDMDGDGLIIPVVEKITPEIQALAKGTNSPTAVGGMVSKLDAAILAADSGSETYIANGAAENIILRIIDGEQVGTRFLRSTKPMGSKKRWLAYFQRSSGSLTIDSGASEAIIQKGSSLLAAGVTGFKGVFRTGDVVDIQNADGETIARGEISFSSTEMTSIFNKTASELNELYPDRTRLEVVHRDALVLL